MKKEETVERQELKMSESGWLMKLWFKTDQREWDLEHIILKQEKTLQVFVTLGIVMIEDTY